MQNPFATRDHKITQSKHNKKWVRLVGSKPTKFNRECVKDLNTWI